MQATIDEALSALFGSPQTLQVGTPQAGTAGLSQPDTAIDQERLQFAAAQKAIDSLKVLLDSGPAAKRRIPKSAQ